MDYKEKVITLLNSQELSKEQKEKLEKIFPELCKNNDEKIRDEILVYIGSKQDIDLNTHNKWCSWLEKQGESVIQNEDNENIRKYLMNYVKYASVGNSLFDDVNTRKVILGWLEKQGNLMKALQTSNARIGELIEENYNIKEQLDPQGEQFIQNVPSREVILAIWDLGNEWKELTGGSISTEHGTQLSYIQNHWQESEYYLRAKQDEQKNVDKSKFNVGDWVVTSYGKVNQIITVDEDGDGYTLDDGTYFSGSWCDMYHLWAIQDAKDGDVLVCNDNPFLFSKYEKDEYGLVCCSYCGIADSDYGEFLINTNAKKYWCDIEFVYPATKEQRDLLFQKMVEAGYLWDENKKELRAINLYCQENCKGYQETGRCFADGECEAKKNADSCWSEEDEEMIECLNNCLDELEGEAGWRYIYVNNKNVELNKVRNWVKSIKERIGGKSYGKVKL